MASKRKRQDANHTNDNTTTALQSCKKHKRHAPSPHVPEKSPIVHDLLRQYYSDTLTLRQYLLSRLPASSRLRRKKIATLSAHGENSHVPLVEGCPRSAVCQVLDSVVVCSIKSRASTMQKARDWHSHLIAFSQKEAAVADDSRVTISREIEKSEFAQSEIVDFVVWHLFSKDPSSAAKHLLCRGFRKAQFTTTVHQNHIPGLVQTAQNQYVETLKTKPWPQILALLGQSGESIMVNLLLESAIFVPVTSGYGNLYQLSGLPLSDIQRPLGNKNSDSHTKPLRSLSDVTLIRSRMLYARAAFTARGFVHTGLRHIHVLNRCPHVVVATDEDDQKSKSNEQNTIRVMMYMFPRQFGLHNVFTSMTDFSKTTQKLQDYTLREEEINRKFPNQPLPNTCDKPQRINIPKRLRGEPKSLVQRLQILHGRCSYAELLWHYCPTVLDTTKKSPRGGGNNGNNSSQKNDYQANQVRLLIEKGKSLVDLATPQAHVSTFCQAVLSKIIPNDFWGTGSVQSENKAMLMKKVDQFIKLRRFESVSLHELAQGFKTANISWLAPSKLKGTGEKCSGVSDTRKRNEIFVEFLYYIFDSLLIPLVRSNFYVTESSLHRYKLFYFRHDVWRQIAEPEMGMLKTRMFEEVKIKDAVSLLHTRSLGFSQIRLLPKGATVRPIMNLKRKTTIKGSTKLMPSINTALGPIHSMLKLEKDRDPKRLGSAMFSVGEMYQRLKDFGRDLVVEQYGTTGNNKRLYFAKVDVQAAFDTIPQSAVLRLMKSIPKQSQYELAKHLEVKAGESATNKTTTDGNSVGIGLKRWCTFALENGDSGGDFRERVEQRLATNKKNTVFVDPTAVKQTHETGKLMRLMQQHVEQNLVRVGKKYYRQRSGIPQGSVLSSILCNYFYADLEAKELGFNSFREEGGGGGAQAQFLLLRLIDDFLLITTDEAMAAGFVRKMHNGIPSYGVSVNPAKTLVNFDMAVNGQQVPRVESGKGFPYCGTLIDCKTLNIAKDRDRGRMGGSVENSLTVDFGRLAGRNFERKVLKTFKMQGHAMFFDTRHNSERTVLKNLNEAFVETATKMWAHARCLATRRQIHHHIYKDIITKLIDVASALLRGKARKARHPEYECKINRFQISWVAYNAFRAVLGRKQANHGSVVAWLDEQIARMERGGKTAV